MPLPRFIALLALLTTLLAPALRYLLEARGLTLDPNNDMAVPATQYFAAALPACAAFIGGLLRWRGGWRGVPPRAGAVTATAAWIHQHQTAPWALAAAALALFLLQPLLPDSLRLLGHFGALMGWTAAAAALFLPGKRRRQALVTLILAAELALALQRTFFGAFVFGLLFLLMVEHYIRPWSRKRLALLALGSVVLVGFLLLFKYEYRAAVGGPAGAQVPPLQRIRAFSQTLVQRLQDPWNAWAWDRALVRLNQGAHTSHVYARVPAVEPWARGETIGRAIAGAFVPRFLWPDKPRAGGYDNCVRFMGETNVTYSHNIGLFGEAYANFGIWGGALFLFLYGWGLRALHDALFRLSPRYPGAWLWLYFLLAPALHVEGDFGIVFNHVVKAGAVAFLCMRAKEKISPASMTPVITHPAPFSQF